MGAVKVPPLQCAELLYRMIHGARRQVTFDPVACPSPGIVPPASRLRSTLMYEWIALNGRGAVDVLDEQDFVADLVIEELVDGASGEEETEAAGW